MLVLNFNYEYVVVENQNAVWLRSSRNILVEEMNVRRHKVAGKTALNIVVDLTLVTEAITLRDGFAFALLIRRYSEADFGYRAAKWFEARGRKL